ncbi:hypothetical protein G6F56_006574 [Rhizopus delemar]|nr:hypothetical protein G6F56_006574 [Rhizopus delemar]
MVWNTNYQKLAAATLFTLFFAGKKFAPKCRINGIHVQDYLQNHYFNCFAHVAKRVKENELEHLVIGYDTMNEPGQGYLALNDITRFNDVDTDFKMGLMPTAFQGMLLGSGIPVKVEQWEFAWSGPKKNGEVLVDPKGKQAWLSEQEMNEVDSRFGWKRASAWSAGCIWANHGVWDKDTQKVLISDYFAIQDKQPVKYTDYWLDHLKNYVQAIREVYSKALIFVQPPVLEVPPELPFATERLVYAPHWYDGLTLVKKKWCSYNVDFINLNRGKYGTGPLRFVRALRVGEKSIRQCFVDQLKTLKNEGLENIGSYPCILGEIGIPFDMETGINNKDGSFFGRFLALFLSLFQQQQSQGNTDDPNSNQNRAMDASINALEQNLLNYTLWTYVPDNDLKWGDQWNGEDLSIWQVNGLERPSNHFKPSLSSVTTASTIIAESQDKKETVDTYTKDTDSFHSEYGLLSRDFQNVRDIPCLHRPHPRVTAGTPTGIRFISPTEKASASFEYSFRPNVDCDTPTEVHVPIKNFPLPPETKVDVSHGNWKLAETNGEYWVLSWCIDQVAEDIEPRLKLEGVSAQK